VNWKPVKQLSADVIRLHCLTIKLDRLLTYAIEYLREHEIEAWLQRTTHIGNGLWQVKCHLTEDDEPQYA